MFSYTTLSNCNFYILYTGFSNDSSWYFYPHKDEHIDINSAQSEDTIDNQRQVDAKEQSSKRANKKKW